MYILLYLIINQRIELVENGKLVLWRMEDPEEWRDFVVKSIANLILGVALFGY